MGQSLGAPDQVGPWLPGHRVVIGPDVEVPPHPSGQVDHDVIVLLPDALYHLLVVGHGPGPPAGLRLTDVAVHDGCTSRGGIQGRVGNLGRGHWNVLAASGGVAGTGYGTRDDHVAVHGSGH